MGHAGLIRWAPGGLSPPKTWKSLALKPFHPKAFEKTVRFIYSGLNKSWKIAEVWRIPFWMYKDPGYDTSQGWTLETENPEGRILGQV